MCTCRMCAVVIWALFFFQAEDGIRDLTVTGVQTCALPISAADFARTKRIYAKQVELVGLLHRAGVPILAGTDVLNPYCFPGFSLHDELVLLVEAGLTPMEALQAATRNPAIFLKATDSLGTIAAGKLADLVLLDADPIADIHNTTKINAVILDGQLLDQAARQRLLDLVRLQVALPPPDSARH